MKSLIPQYLTTKTYRERPFTMTTHSILRGDIIRWSDNGMTHVMSVSDFVRIAESEDGPDIAVFGPVTTTTRKGRRLSNGKRSAMRIISRHCNVQMIGYHDRHWDE